MKIMIAIRAKCKKKALENKILIYSMKTLEKSTRVKRFSSKLHILQKEVALSIEMT